MKLALLLAPILALTLSLQADAGGFGGSRGGGSSFSRGSSFSSSRSSSFGGSRSSGAAATISRPSPRYSPPPSQTVNHYHESGSGGNGLVTGMVLGSMLSNHGGTTVVNGSGGYAQPVTADSSSSAVVYSGDVQYPGTVVVQQGHGFFYYLVWFMILAMIGAILIAFWRDCYDA